MLRKIRTALALVFWLGITVLFLDVSGALHAWLAWMAKLQFLPAVLAANVGVTVLVIVLTLVVGRIYCSVICPLGVMQDAFNRLGARLVRDKAKRRFGRFRYWYPRWAKVVRWAVFALVLAAIVVGAGAVVRVFAPYSSYGRIVTTLLRPGVDALNNVLADLSAQYDDYTFSHVELWMRSGAALAVALTSLIVVGGMAVWRGRFYCNTICPVGTVLGWLARRSILRIHINADRCTKCGLCERRCKAMAIDAGRRHVDLTRCVDCFDCLDACRTGALSYGIDKPLSVPATDGKAAAGGKAAADSKAKSEGKPIAKDVTNLAEDKAKSEGESTANNVLNASDGTSRRAFLATMATLTVDAKLRADSKIVDGGLAVIADKKPYRRETPICPPGALSLRNLSQKCTGCLLCVSACPNDVLRPASDLTHFLQPTLSYERNHCRPECHACSDVCPAGAILPLGKTHEEKKARKSSLKIGRAVWIADNCVPLTDGVSCGNCARHCPTGAITMVPSRPDDPRSPRIPTVDDERCIGCGACEHLCPSRPYSAIHVEGIEVQREI